VPSGGVYAHVAFPTVNSVLCAAFVWARRAPNLSKRRFPASRAAACLVHYLLLQKITSPRFTLLNFLAPGSTSPHSSTSWCGLPVQLWQGAGQLVWSLRAIAGLLRGISTSARARQDTELAAGNNVLIHCLAGAHRGPPAIPHCYFRVL
jgi:hypothetical protein